MKSVGIWFVVMGFCLGSISKTEAQNSASASISGQVTDQAGKALNGVVVRLERDGLRAGQTSTSSSGQFHFNVEPSKQPYALVVDEPQFLPTWTNLFLRTNDEVKANLVLSDD